MEVEQHKVKVACYHFICLYIGNTIKKKQFFHVKGKAPNPGKQLFPSGGDRHVYLTWQHVNDDVNLWHFIVDKGVEPLEFPDKSCRSENKHKKTTEANIK